MRRFLFVLLLCGLSFNALEAVVTVRLRDAVTVKKRMVRLGDIASISGGSGSLAALPLLRLGADQRGSTLSYQKIKTRIEGGFKKPFILIGGDVDLQLLLVKVSAKRCADLVLEALQKQFSGEKLRVRVDDPVRMPEGVAGIQGLFLKEPPTLGSGNRWSARFRAKDGEGNNRYFECRGTVTRQIALPVTAERMKRGQRIRAVDLSTGFFPQGSGKPPAAVGRVLARDVEKGVRLTRADLLPEAPFRAGTRIRVEWRAPGIRIVFFGRALEPGRPGDRIRIRNELSGRVIHGRVGKNRLALLEGGGQK